MDKEDITFRTYRNALHTTPGPNQPADKTDILYLKLIRMSQRTIISDFYRSTKENQVRFLRILMVTL